jgi:hypothetical protein
VGWSTKQLAELGDADEQTREDLAERLRSAPEVRKVRTAFPSATS